MPLHLNSITNESENADLLTWLIQKGMDEYDSLFITEDKKYFHIRSNIKDRISGQNIGRIVYTIFHAGKALEIKDIDIVLNNPVPTRLLFNILKDASSDRNEYYEAETVNAGAPLELETVNRHIIPDDLLNTERDVYISAFPFKLSIFNDIKEFNTWAGFGNSITLNGTDFNVEGFSEKFIMPGGAFGNNEIYTFIIGKVVSFRDVEIAFGETVLRFILVHADTALGTIPIAVGRDVFDTENICEGCIIAMNADIKADLGNDSDFFFSDSYDKLHG